MASDSVLAQFECPSEDGWMLQPIWDDWHETVIGMYCPFCGLMLRFLSRQPASVFRMEEAKIPYIYGHFR